MEESHNRFAPLIPRKAFFLDLGFTLLVGTLLWTGFARKRPQDISIPWLPISFDKMVVETLYQDWGTIHKNTNVSGSPLNIQGMFFLKGIGTHANSALKVSFANTNLSFSGGCGLDSVATRGSIRCLIKSGDLILFESPILNHNSSAFHFQVSIKNLNNIILEMRDAGDGNTMDHANWVDLNLE